MVLNTLFENTYEFGVVGAQAIYGNVWVAERFQAWQNHTFKKTFIKIYRIGSPGTVDVSIQGVDENDKPDGNVLSSITFNGNSLGTNTAGVWVELQPIPICNLEDDEIYCIVVKATSGNINNCVMWKYGEILGFTLQTHVKNSSDGGVSWTQDTDRTFLFRNEGLLLPLNVEMEYYKQYDNTYESFSGSEVIAQSFTVGEYNHFINQINLKIGTGDPDPDHRLLTISIKLADGEGKPTGSALVSTVFRADYEINEVNWIAIPITQTNLLALTQYVLIVDGGSSATDWNMDSTTPLYSGGSYLRSTDNGTTWTIDNTKDLMFDICGEYPPPVANAGPDQQGGISETLSFDGSSSYFIAPATSIVSYDWDWNDGTTHGNVVNPTHAWTSLGVYTITLVVTDDRGQTGSDTCIVTISTGLNWLLQSGNPYASGNEEYSDNGTSWTDETNDFNFEVWGVEVDTVFRAYVGDLGTYGSGDVILGDYIDALGEGIHWDQSTGTLRIKGDLETGNIDADLVTITNLTISSFKPGEVTENGGNRSIPESTLASVSTVSVVGGPTNWTTLITTNAFTHDTEEAWIAVSTMVTDAGGSTAYHIALRVKESGASNYYPNSSGIESHIKLDNVPITYLVQIPLNANGKAYEIQMAIFEEVTLTFDSYATYWGIDKHIHSVS